MQLRLTCVCLTSRPAPAAVVHPSLSLYGERSRSCSIVCNSLSLLSTSPGSDLQRVPQHHIYRARDCKANSVMHTPALRGQSQMRRPQADCPVTAPHPPLASTCGVIVCSSCAQRLSLWQTFSRQTRRRPCSILRDGDLPTEQSIARGNQPAYTCTGHNRRIRASLV